LDGCRKPAGVQVGDGYQHRGPHRPICLPGGSVWRQAQVQRQGIGDLYTVYATTQRDGADFNLAFIPASFNVPHREEFDTEYMRALFQVGFDMAAKGNPWLKVPPGY
jgi:hypothetical protein